MNDGTPLPEYILCLPKKLPNLIAVFAINPTKEQTSHNQPWKGPLDGGLPGLRSKESDCTHVEQEDANAMELN